MTKQLKIDKMKKREDKYVPGLYTSAHDQMVIEKNEVFEPSTIQRPKVIGKIDLSGINVTTHAGKDADHTPSADYIISIPTREEIEKKINVWRPDWKFLRKSIPNISTEYADGQPLRIKTKDGRKGYAIGCLDPLKQNVGYYIAINLYGQGVITKMSDKMMEDGVMAGEWNPDAIQSINKATDGEADIINSLLMPQIEKERELFHECLVQEFLELAEEQARRLEEERKRKEEERMKAEAEEREREKQEALARIEEQRQQLMSEEQEELDSYPMTVQPEELAHLPYVRHQKTMRYADWPRVDGEVHSARYFDGMKTLSYIIEGNGTLPTYILSRAYVREMNECREEMMMRFVNYRQLLNGEQFRNGVLCYNLAGVDVTVIYEVVAPEGEAREVIRFAVINDDQLVCTFASNRTNAAVNPYITHLSMVAPSDPRYSKIKNICNRVIEKIILHIMFEQQTEALTHDENENENENKATVPNGSPLGDDIMMRTKSWYNSVTIPSTEVAPYESHRWKGSGENKTLEPVSVSGYTKGAYTRAAQCEK